MDDLVVGIGLVFVIEGLIYALIPGSMRRMVEDMTKLSDSTLRTGGLAAVVIGVFIVWLIRGG